MEYYVHHVPGRLRVRIPAIRSNPRKAVDVERLLDIYGVESIKVNHLTGSAVVVFDTGVVTADQLLSLLREQGYYDNARVITCDEKIQRATHVAASKFGRVFFSYAASKALEASGLPLLAALI